MAVGVTVGSITGEIGAGSFVHSFFSTVSVHCETNGWGSRYPRLMNELYQGHLPSSHAIAAIEELRDAKSVLDKIPPSEVVWDAENRDAQPPWGTNISSDITSLGNYFVSSTGRDVFALLEEVLQVSADRQEDVSLG
ncbi:MAG: immunity 70 family protein [Marinobacter sp.]|uniref:immunity 70 family protein n=1 Tax=Pseudomonadota TaxID=1224 RepID=UPI00329752D5